MSNPAETYEHYIVPALFDPWATKLIERAAPRDGDRVLDVACGTGIVARRAAAKAGNGGTVSGCDPNPNMLAVAESAAGREGAAIEWHQAPAEELPYEDGCFDLVLCQQGAQFFRDRQQGFSEMARVLAPEGRIALSTWQAIDRHDFFNALHEAMQEHLGTPAASAPFTLPAADEVRTLLSGAGFRQIEVEPVSMTAHYPDPERFLKETIDALMAVVTSMLDIDEQELQKGTGAVLAEMRPRVEKLTEGDKVVLPWHTHIATGVQ